MFVNHHSKQVTAKIVYYGPGLSGKTTNLQYIFSVTNPKTRGELVSIQTDIERTLFFDLLPINVGLVNGYQAKFQLYTVPGQVFYDSTRQLVLRGADGIVFVADSQEAMEKANLDSFENLKKNLAKYSQSIDELSLVFQYNKRDLKNVLPIEMLNRKLNRLAAPYYGAAAIIGTGVIETLREISSMTLRKIKGLLDQNLQVQNMKPFVNFDTDHQQVIIKKDELPIKKLTGNTTEEFLPPSLAGDDELQEEPFKDDSEEPFKDDGEEPFKDEDEEIPVDEGEEVLELKEFEQLEEIKAPPVLERTDEIPELKGFDEEEIQIELGEITGDDFAPVKTDKIPLPEKISNLKKFEKTDEIEKPQITKPAKPVKELEKTALEMDVEKVELLKAPPKIRAYEFDDEPKPNEPAAQPKPIAKPNELNVRPRADEPVAQPKPTPKPNEPVAQPKPGPKPNEANVKPKANEPDAKAKPNEFEFLEKLRDDSRLTFIRKMILLPGPDSPMVIEVRDKGDKSLLLEPLEIKITPGVKKITLILDIK